METPQEQPSAPLIPPKKIFLSPELLKALFIPVAIVAAGIIIATAVYVIRSRQTIQPNPSSAQAVRPVMPTDHIIGNPSAPVTIIEYGDIDSSYSKAFQLTMEQLMTEYADGGKVAWVYRHFPLPEHVNAGAHALAAECAASLSVPTTFFRFIDAMQTMAPGDVQFDPKSYSVILPQFGIDQVAFTSCVTAGTFTNRIHEDYDNALAAGATGSPFIVLLVHGQKPAPINGSVPYATMKKLIVDALAKAGA